MWTITIIINSRSQLIKNSRTKLIVIISPEIDWYQVSTNYERYQFSVLINSHLQVVINFKLKLSGSLFRFSFKIVWYHFFLTKISFHRHPIKIVTFQFSTIIDTFSKFWILNKIEFYQFPWYNPFGQIENSAYFGQGRENSPYFTIFYVVQSLFCCC